MSYLVGLTGGIASGKTTIANKFHTNHQIDIIDADIAAREVVAVGQPALEQISQHFGIHVLTNKGELDRKKLREIIFSQPTEKLWLNNLLHPLIRLNLEAKVQQVTSPYALIVAPLLIENGLHQWVKKVIVVDVSASIQLERILARDRCSVGQAKSIIASQLSPQERLSFADFIITNNTIIEQLGDTQTQNATLTLDNKIEALHRELTSFSLRHYRGSSRKA